MPPDAQAAKAGAIRSAQLADGTPPQVRLGSLQRGGLAPAIMAIVERGVRERSALASGLHAEVELGFKEHYPPVRVLFADQQVLVEDGACESPDLRVEGALTDLISLLVAPAVGGVPTPLNSRGRAALGMLAQRRIRIQGRIGLMRRMLAIIRI